MSATGWTSWAEPRVRDLEPVVREEGDLVRYCPRCDTRTLWQPRGDGIRQCCHCQITVTTILKPNEIGRLRRHYARTL